MQILSRLKLSLGVALACGTTSAFAVEVEFDRPGQALSTSIVPKGHLAWEQALPSLQYDQSRINGLKHTTLDVQTDLLLRAGIGFGTELRLGWDGQVWKREKIGNNKHHVDGLGDMQLGLKKSIDLADDSLKLAVLAQVNLDVGDDEVSRQNEIYTLGSSLQYQFSPLVNTGITMLYEYEDSRLAVTAIPNISYEIQGNLSGFSEYVFRKAESQSYESVVNTGLSWLIDPRLQLDASIGYSFNRQNPQFNAGLGFAYLF